MSSVQCNGFDSALVYIHNHRHVTLQSCADIIRSSIHKFDTNSSNYVQEAQLRQRNSASAMHIVVARLLSINVTETCVTETYAR